MLTEKHIKHFIEKGKSFFDKYVSYTTNHLGIPSIIKVKKYQTKSISPYVCYCVTQSVERHYSSLNIAKLIEAYMYLPQKDCQQIAEYIVQKKYEQYIDFIMTS